MEKRGALLQFYNETAKAKLKAVINYILNLLRQNRKMVVFAHHKLMMDCLQEAIVEEVSVFEAKTDRKLILVKGFFRIFLLFALMDRLLRKTDKRPLINFNQTTK